MKRTISMAIALMMVTSIICSSFASAELTTFDDYQFVTDTKIQAHSWEFDLTVENPSWSVTGRILTYHFYQINTSEPVNYISCVDILVGTGPLTNGGGDYNMTFSWGDRYVNVSFVTQPADVDYVISNMGNIHCIARTQDSLNILKSLVNNTMIKLSGYLVDVTGYFTNSTLFWKTDTQFGNQECEILVISDATPGTITQADLMVAYILIIAIIASVAVSIIIHRYDKKKCAIPVKKVGKVSRS